MVSSRLRAVAQHGSALDWGSRGRRFKSGQPDHQNPCVGQGFQLIGVTLETCSVRGECAPVRAEGRSKRSAAASSRPSNRCPYVSSPRTGSRRRGLVMAYKLLDAAQDRWRKVNSPELVALARAGTEFKDGIQTERSTDQSRDAA